MNKVKWHQDNKLLVFKLSSGNCNKCNKFTDIYEGSIHHTTYKNINGLSVYKADTQYLFNSGVIVWICKKCHRNIHQIEKIDNSTKIREYCEVCGSKNGLLERGKLISIEKYLCKKCFRNIRDGKMLPEQIQLNLFS